MSEAAVIVGAGHGAGQAVASLRQGGWEAPIVLVGEEAYPPYQRPPLSKKFLAGELELERLYFKPLSFYESARAELRVSTRAVRLDRAAKTVELESGESVSYAKLILATGTRPRLLPAPGADLEGIHYLRSIADVDAIRPAFKTGGSIVIVGAGYIGLEVAAVAASAGLKVTVLEAVDRVMARVTSPVVSEFYADAHRGAGVDLRLGARLAGFEGQDGHVQQAVLEGGEAVDADLVVIGVGVLPNQELAADAGLKADNGIWVDEFAATEDPDIYAIGDCTNHPSALYGRRLRLESVHNALEQAKTAAQSICGAPAPYDQAPWFWSDQYDLKLQTVGLSQGYDEFVVRGHPAARKFAVFYLKEGALIAVDAVNAPAEFLGAKKLVAAKMRPDKDQLTDPAIPLKSLA